VLDNIADVFNKDAIPQLVELNGWDVLDAPALKYGTIDNHSIEELTNFLAKLTDSGFLDPTPELRDWAMSKVDAPKVGEQRMPSIDERVAEIKTAGLLEVEEEKSDTKIILANTDTVEATTTIPQE